MSMLLVGGDVRTHPDSSRDVDAPVVPPRTPIIVGDWWDTPTTTATPSLLTVNNAEGEGLGLFYPGRVNAIWGEPNRGKSLLCQHLAVHEAAEGRRTLTIDLEKPLAHFRSRIEMLGATRDTARHLGYWNPDRTLDSDAALDVIGFCNTHTIGTVILDAVGRATAQAGIDDNDNAEYRRWFDAVIMPLERAGLTVILVDHPRKDAGSQGGKAAPLYPKGAGSKLDVIDGAAYAFVTIRAFSRDRSGHAQLVCAKDTEGARSVGDPAADMRVEPADDGASIRITLGAPDASTPAGNAFRPTNYMQKVLEQLSVEEPLSISELKRRIGGKGEWVGVAVERLLEAGDVTEAAGPRKARLIRRTSPKQKARDPENRQQMS